MLPPSLRLAPSFPCRLLRVGPCYQQRLGKSHLATQTRLGEAGGRCPGIHRQPLAVVPFALDKGILGDAPLSGRGCPATHQLVPPRVSRPSASRPKHLACKFPRTAGAGRTLPWIRSASRSHVLKILLAKRTPIVVCSPEKPRAQHVPADRTTPIDPIPDSAPAPVLAEGGLPHQGRGGLDAGTQRGGRHRGLAGAPPCADAAPCPHPDRPRPDRSRGPGGLAGGLCPCGRRKPATAWSSHNWPPNTSGPSKICSCRSPWWRTPGCAWPWISPSSASRKSQEGSRCAAGWAN